MTCVRVLSKVKDSRTRGSKNNSTRVYNKAADDRAVYCRPTRLYRRPNSGSSLRNSQMPEETDAQAHGLTITLDLMVNIRRGVLASTHKDLARDSPIFCPPSLPSRVWGPRVQALGRPYSPHPLG